MSIIPCRVTCCTLTDFAKRRSSLRSQPDTPSRVVTPLIVTGKHALQPVRSLSRGIVLPVASSHRPVYPRPNGSRFDPTLIGLGEPTKKIADACTSYGSMVTALTTKRFRWSELAYVYSSARLNQLVGVPPRLPLWLS